MNRFTAIISSLRKTRLAQLESSKRKKRVKKSSKKKSSKKKMKFDNPELEKLFNGMSKEMQDFISKGE